MRKFILSLLCFFISFYSIAQQSTSLAEGTYPYCAGASCTGTGWLSGNCPEHGSGPVDVVTYCTLQADNTIDHTNSSYTVKDQSVLYINQDFNLRETSSLLIEAGGTLVVRGNMLADGPPVLTLSTPLQIVNNGDMVIKGNLITQDNVVFTGTGTVYTYNPPQYNSVVPATTLSSGDETSLQTNDPALYNLAEAPVGPLPVVLREYTVQQNMQNIVLKWIAEKEINFSHYQLMHSNNGLDFGLLATLEGKGSNQDNPSYQYMHQNPQEGWNYFRLLAIDLDGTSEDHGMLSLFFKRNSTSRIVQNPVINQLLQVSVSDLSEKATLELFTLEGNRVYQKAAGNGRHTLQLTPGLYILKLSDQGSTELHRVVIQ